MKKFKHKITGYIAAETTSEKNYKVSEPKNFTIPKWIVENSNDWEEIIENNSKRLLYKGNILYNVKRLSDNQEFTIGDKVLNSRNELKTILGFVDTCNIQVELGTGNFVDYIDNLCNIQHYKEPILTTEDGYECTLDDRVFGVLPKANWQTDYYDEEGVPVSRLFNPEGKRWNPSSEWLWFKTKENAEKYIYENKPEFSRKQILDAISSNIGFSVFGLGDVIIESDFKHTLKL